MLKPSCHLGPIIKHMNGYGFKVTFNTSDEAQRYKEMTSWIIEHDKYKIYNKKGFHEKNGEKL